MHSITSSRPVDRVIAAVAALVALAFAVWVVSIATIDLSGIVFLLFILLWVSAPYLALAAAILVLSTSWISRVVLALGVVASALFGLWTFSLIGEDAQGGLLLLFVPMYQDCGIGLVMGIVAVIEVVKHLLKREKETRTE